MATIARRKTNKGVRFKCVIRKAHHKEVSKTFDKISDARRWGKNTEAKMDRGDFIETNEATQHDLSEAITRYQRDVIPLKAKSTQPDQVRHLEWWRSEIGQVRMSQVTPALLVGCKDKLKSGDTHLGRKRSGSTVNRYMAVLSHLMNTAKREWQWITVNPMESISKFKEGRPRDRFLDHDEQMKLIEASQQSTNPDMECIVVLALSTGVRKGEIESLTWKDIDLNNGWATLRQTKNSDVRRIPLTGRTLDLLIKKSKVKRIDTNYLFPRKFRPGIETKPKRIKDDYRSVVKAAGLGEDVVFHTLRHTAASNMAMAGWSPSEIARILGHRTLAMVSRYAKVADDHLHAKVAALNANQFGSIGGGDVGSGNG